MLAKCSNPRCSAPFRSLQQGKLFCLQPDPMLNPSKASRVEYFWLCEICSTTMTLRIEEDGNVAPRLLPEPMRHVPDGISLSFTEQKQGWLLRSIGYRLPGHPRDRIRPRPTEERHFL